jgi:conjugative transposon TraJ protein
MNDIHSLQSVLDQLYNEMLPLCSQLIGVGRLLAGFAALWFIGSRVWRHLANAEPIDFYPLLRPFAIGLCIMLFPWVLALINGVMSPTVAGTAAMVSGSNNAIVYLMNLKEEAIKKTPAWQMYVGPDGGGDRDKWYRYTHPAGSDEGTIEGLGNDIQFAMAKASYNFRNSVKQWMSEILQVIFEAAALCIKTIRTFYLIVLSILGPIVFGISVFDGFQHTLTSWIARYINVFLWLPVANIFGAIIAKIQENMLRIDLEQIARYGDTFFSSTDTAYLIFLVMGIVGYFTVPSVCNYIVQAAGGNVLVHKATSFFVGGATSMISSAIGGSTALLNSSSSSSSNNSSNSSGGSSGSGGDSSDDYMHNKLKGN